MLHLTSLNPRVESDLYLRKGIEFATGDLKGDPLDLRCA